VFTVNLYVDRANAWMCNCRSDRHEKRALEPSCGEFSNPERMQPSPETINSSRQHMRCDQFQLIVQANSHHSKVVAKVLEENTRD
jgi:hypothetical protein